MEYSLRDAQHLFWLIGEHGLPLPLVYYQCDYKFFDTQNYYMAINEHPMSSELKKRLQEHLTAARFMCELANNNWEANNIEIFASFSHSSPPDKFYYVETENIGVKDKPLVHRLLTFAIQFDSETLTPKWKLVAEKSDISEKERKKMQEKYECAFVDLHGKEAKFFQVKALDLFRNMCEVIRQLRLLLDIKEEHPYKNIIDSLIPKHVNERYREELEHIFSFGKYHKEHVKWMSGYKELQEYLRPHYDNKTILNKHSQNWYDFAMNNFIQKNGRPLNIKSLQNAPTRQDRRKNHSRNTQNNSPNHSQTVPKSFPTISIEAGRDVTINLKRDTYSS